VLDAQDHPLTVDGGRVSRTAAKNAVVPAHQPAKSPALSQGARVRIEPKVARLLPIPSRRTRR
jgi:hypothetical protein